MVNALVLETSFLWVQVPPGPLIHKEIIMSFKKFLQEYFASLDGDVLEEKLITFGKTPYPKFNTVVIMAGGAGSGKGFIKNKLLGVEGYTFDVDAIKEIAVRTPAIVKKAKEVTGVDIDKLDFLNPENTSTIHNIIGDIFGIDKGRLKRLYMSILSSPADRKPNLIFDVTLKDLYKLENLTRDIKNLGYSDKNIHIVWVINHIEVAKVQNTMRNRSVPVEILVNTHRGVSQTMHDILTMGDSLKKYMDGSIVLAFNQTKVDSLLVKNDKNDGSYVKEALYVYVKRPGEPVVSLDEINKEIREKIASYVPPGVTWV